MGGDPLPRAAGLGRGSALTALLDTNVVIRHVTGEPREQARRATRFLAGADELLLADAVVAECVFVLESVYRLARARISELMRSALAYPAIVVLDETLLLRAFAVYEQTSLHFVDGYLIAVAELSGVHAIASFDRALDRIGSIDRVAP